MRKVFLCEYIHPEAYAYLKAHAEVIHDWDRLSEAEALINRNLKMTDEVMGKAKSLRVIGFMERVSMMWIWRRPDGVEFRCFRCLIKTAAQLPR